MGVGHRWNAGGAVPRAGRLCLLAAVAGSVWVPGRALAGSARDAPDRPLVVAIVDDAFDLDDPRLSDLWWSPEGEQPANGVDDDGNGHVDDVRGWDVADRDGDVSAPSHREAELRHGTLLAVVVAQAVREAFGDAAPDRVRLLPIKAVADSAGDALIRSGYLGIEYAVASKADLVLCAWNVPRINTEERQVLERAAAAGMLLVGSSGNLGNNTPAYPAAHPAMVSVTARDATGGRPARASFGGTVDLSAPWDASLPDQVEAQVIQGTSAAAAAVAGAAAVAWAEHREWSADELRAALWATATPAGGDGVRVAASMGAGQLDAQALRMSSPWTHRGLWTKPVGALPLTSTKEPTSFSLAAPGEVEHLTLHLHDQGSAAAALRSSVLSVFAGRGDEATPVWTGPLVDLPVDLKVPGRRAYVRLEPGRGRLRALLTYRAEPVDVSRRYCRDTVLLTEPGSLDDGSGDAPYAPATDCRWVITAPEGHVVRFAVDAIDTQPFIDAVQIFHGDSTAGQPIAGLSGQQAPATFTSWGRQVTVWWVTDEGVELQGWSMRYTFEPSTEVSSDRDLSTPPP